MFLKNQSLSFIANIVQAVQEIVNDTLAAGVIGAANPALGDNNDTGGLTWLLQMHRVITTMMLVGAAIRILLILMGGSS
eukprot:scaffold75760_cov60-Cyclotella_meneghiniana.AAC.12